MQARPPDLPDSAVAGAVADGWRIPSPSVEYRAVGYGSHHWSVDDATGGRWFASVDPLAGPDPDASFDRLCAALGAATVAREAGLTFVVAPVRAMGGSIVQRLPGGYALALYPYVAGRSGEFHDSLPPADAAELIRLVCSLHDLGATGAAPGAGVESFTIAGRGGLEGALAEVSDHSGWSGPYGEPLRRLLAEHAGNLERGLREHDRLVAAAGPQQGRLVLTHGEPHPGNLIRSSTGMALVDWDTTLLAPPERDVWLLDARTDGRASAEYTARSGRSLDPRLLARYRLAWWLVDVVEFVGLLRTAPDITADTGWSWDALRHTLDLLAE